MDRALTPVRLAKEFPVAGFERRGEFQYKDYDDNLFGVICFELEGAIVNANGVICLRPFAECCARLHWFQNPSRDMLPLGNVNSFIGAPVDFGLAYLSPEKSLRRELSEAAIWLDANGNLDAVVTHATSMNTALTRLTLFEIDGARERRVRSISEYCERYRSAEISGFEREYLNVNYPALAAGATAH